MVIKKMQGALKHILHFKPILHNDCLVALKFTTKTSAPKTKLAKATINQLKNYFLDPNFKFNLPLKLNGTPFQQKVWHALTKIPFGKTITYGELAKKLTTSPRAIGNACRANPIPIIIPCHRVIAKKSLGGFMGKTTGKFVDIKKMLLQYEVCA
jgi:methylated-DNA-[protein]-cysteine S-methyltransferase